MSAASRTAPPSCRDVVGIALALLLATAALAVPAPASPQDSPRARASVMTEGPIVVGQPVTIQVEVLVPSYFTGAPAFGALEPDDAVTFFNDRGANFIEREGGRTWAGQRRSYTVYPYRAGTYDLPPIRVAAAWADGGTPTVDTVSTEPLRFETMVPDEARGLDDFVAAGALRLSSAIDPGSDTIHVGDAFERTITVEVAGTLSHVVPPVHWDPIDGLAIYPGTPDLEDQGGPRGEPPSGVRRERAQYVAEAEGSYDLPEVTITWWDWTAGALRTETAPGASFVVVANPDLVPEIELPPDSLDTAEASAPNESRLPPARTIAGIVVGFVLLAFVLRLLPARVTRLAEHRRLRLAAREASEPARFRRVLTAARADDARACANALSVWLSAPELTLRPRTAGALARAAGDPDLKRDLDALGEALYGDAGGEAPRWQGSPLAHRLEGARKALMEAPGAAPGRGTTLGPLNPRPPVAATVIVPRRR